MPPYSDLVGVKDGNLTVTLNIANYLYLVQDSLYYSAYLSSLKIAVISTFLCLLLGYPIAYAIARAATAELPVSSCQRWSCSVTLTRWE